MNITSNSFVQILIGAPWKHETIQSYHCGIIFVRRSWRAICTNLLHMWRALRFSKYGLRFSREKERCERFPPFLILFLRCLDSDAIWQTNIFQTAPSAKKRNHGRSWEREMGNSIIRYGADSAGRNKNRITLTKNYIGKFSDERITFYAANLFLKFNHAQKRNYRCANHLFLLFRSILHFIYL